MQSPHSDVETTHARVTLSPPTHSTTIDKGLEKEVTVLVEPVIEPNPTTGGRGDVEAPTVESQQPRHKPGFWSQIPWAGIAGLFVVTLCSIAQLVVLNVSNGKAASEFAKGYLAPNVLLSILNSLSTLALATAVGQGIAIAWWRRAMNGGSVKDLHYSWAFSTSVGSILKKYKRFNLIALTMLVTKVAIVDGILYQRATFTFPGMVSTSKFANEPDTVKTFAAEVFPITGTMGPTQYEAGLATWDYEVEILNWDRVGDDMDHRSDVYNCTGAYCRFVMPGAGFEVRCNSENTTVDYGKAALTAFDQDDSNTTAFQGIPIFSVNFTRTWPNTTNNYSAIILDMLYSNTIDVEDGVCPMNLTRMSCELRPALLNYTVLYMNQNSRKLSQQLHKANDDTAFAENAGYQKGSDSINNLVSFENDQSGMVLDYDCGDEPNEEDYNAPGCQLYNDTWRQVMGVKVVKTVDVIEDFAAGANSTLEGLYLALKTKLAGKGILSYSNHTGRDWSLEEQGISSISSRGSDPMPNSCNYSFGDPSQDILRSINILTLMTIQRDHLYIDQKRYDELYDASLETDYPPLLNGVSSDYTHYYYLTAQVIYGDVFYGSRPEFVYLALALSLVVVICVLPVFWGFWTLGRQVSLSPFEIANAFGSPAFQEVQGNHVDDILKSAGRLRLQYAQAQRANGRKLGFNIAEAALNDN